jgi:hypothetical protein
VRRTAALAAAITVALTGCSTSHPKAPKNPGFLPGTAPAAYRIVYTTGPGRAEVVEVTPERSRQIGTRDGKTVTGTAQSDTRLYLALNGAWREAKVSPPGEPGNAALVGSALAAAERHGRITRDGTGTVLGRECTWWVTNVPFDGGPFAPANAHSSARTCVDRSGLPLADSWRTNGKTVRDRTASEVTTTGVDLSGLRLTDGQTPAPLTAALRTVQVTPRAKPVVTALPGLVAGRSVDVVEPGHRRSRTVFRGGQGDLAVVDELTGPAKLGTGTPADDAVDVGALGKAVLRGTQGGLVVEVLRPDGRLLSVRTTLDEDVVLGWLRGLAR